MLHKLTSLIPLAAIASITSALISSYFTSKIASISREQTKSQAAASQMAGLSLRYNAKEMGRSMMLLDAYRKKVATETATFGAALLEAITQDYPKLKENAEAYLMNSSKSEMKQSFEIEMARRMYSQHFQAVKDLYENSTEFGKDFRAAVGPLCGKVALIFLVTGPMKACSISEKEFLLQEFYCRECKELIKKERKPDTHTIANERLESINNLELVKSLCSHQK